VVAGHRHRVTEIKGASHTILANLVVHFAVTVVVFAVALFFGTGMDLRIHGPTIAIAGKVIAVRIAIAHVALAVVVQVRLILVRRFGTVVQLIRNLVAVVVRVHAVGQSVAVGVGINLVVFAITIVVQTVAQFGLWDIAQAFAHPAQAGQSTGARTEVILNFARDVGPDIVHISVTIIVLAVANLRLCGHSITFAQAGGGAIAFTATGSMGIGDHTFRFHG
jgi:hypothetical protein